MKNSYEEERERTSTKSNRINKEFVWRERELPLSSFNDLFILIDMVIIKKLLKNSYEEEREKTSPKSNRINKEFV